MAIHSNRFRCGGRAARPDAPALWLGSLLLAVSLLLCGPWTLEAADGKVEIKVATLAPENSSLMRICNEMNAEVQKETQGQVAFKLFGGFGLGDEEDVLRKVRIGMIHAAVFTMSALNDVNPDLKVLQVPFLFNDSGEVDHVLQKLDGDLKKGFAAQGFEVLGWPEMGFIYLMSTVPIDTPDSLKGKKVWAKANAPMAQAFMERVGVSTVAINAPDVLVALQTRLVEVVYNSPYYALVTQWNTQVKYMTDIPLVYIGAALLVDRKVFSKIPGPLQETVRRVCAKHIRRLVEQTRQDNREAYDLILKRGVQKVSPTPPQREAFKTLSDSVVSGLDPKQLPRATFDRVKAELAEYRAKQPAKP